LYKKNIGGKSIPPITYIIDYKEDHLDDIDKFVSKVAQAPPTLLHIGTLDTPFISACGAVGWKKNGENRSYKLFTIDQMKERYKNIRYMISELHRIGVKIVIPYICNQTLIGHINKRTGIWMFYDHWNDYLKFGIGSKPEKDPIKWMAKEKNGKLHYNYEMRHQAFIPYNIYRFAPCQNNPYYNQYLQMIVKILAEVGYNGVFVDNGNLNCYCEYCQKKFRFYLQDKYTQNEIASRFGFKHPEEIELGYRGSRLYFVKNEPIFREFLKETYSEEELTRWFGTADTKKLAIEGAGNGWLWSAAEKFRQEMEKQYTKIELKKKFKLGNLSNWGIKTPQDRALWAETQLFWAHSVAENIQMIKKVGTNICGQFLVEGNWGAIHNLDAALFRCEIGHDVGEWAYPCDLLMFEEESDPGMISKGVYFDHIAQYKFALANNVGTAMLPYTGERESTTELCYAEVSAGGGGAYEQAGYSFPEIREQYRKFFEEKVNLFEGYDSYAEVGLAYFFKQIRMGNYTHIIDMYRFTRYLADQHILFDYLIEKGFNDGKLAIYKAIILPDIKYVNDKQIEVVKRYIERGGVAIVTGDSGKAQDDGKPRINWSLKKLAEKEKKTGKPAVTKIGKGMLVWAEKIEHLISLKGMRKEDIIRISESISMQSNIIRANKDLRFKVMEVLDQVVGTELYLDGGKLLSYLNNAGVRQLADPRRGAGIRFNVYNKKDKDMGWVIIHIVNYNVPLSKSKSFRKVIPEKDIEISMNIPKGWEAIKRVVRYVPGDKSSPVSYHIKNGQLFFTLSKINYYTALEVCVQPIL